ncbi:MAG: amidohydrolase [Pseudomonadota bacterium]
MPVTEADVQHDHHAADFCDDPTHQHQNPDLDLYGCPCCSPVMRDIGLMSLPALANAAKPKAWKRLGTPPLAQSGTIVFSNARVMTIDARFSVAEAIAFRGGKIVAVGTPADVKAAAGEKAEIVDCGGRTILPGFIEPHMHFFAIAMMSAMANVGAMECVDAAAVLARIAEVAKVTPDGEWIVARQFDPSLQEGAAHINAEALERAAPNNPVFIYNASLHIGYCNTRALNIASVTATTPNPPGAAFVRDASGAPTGVLQGQAAMYAVLGHNVRAMKLESVPDACKYVCDKANRLGVTTMCDQAVGGFQGKGEVDAFHAYAASGHMTARMRYSLLNVHEKHWDEADIHCGYGDEMVRATGWKLVSDGSNQGRTGYQREAYFGRNDHGLAYIDKDALREMTVKRALQGWQVVIHANGDQAIDNALDAIEAAYAAGVPRERRFRIEHCSVLHDEQIARIKALNVSPSFLIGHVHYWGKAFRDEVFGPEKVMLLGRAQSCTEAGIRWTVHSDEPVSDMGPLRLIDNAVNRTLWKEPGSVLNAAECVSVEQAIISLTRDAAWQCYSEHEIGTLEVGKCADFVILDKDPRDVPPVDITKIKVLETWVDGRRVYAA